MQNTPKFVSLFLLTLLLSSCEFKCNMGSTAEESKDGVKPIGKDGSTLYNNIAISSQGVKINKAYLIFDNGERLPSDNFVDFTRPVRMIVLIDSGWVVTDGKVYLGASEKITGENGNVILDEKDLFESSAPDGITPEDAKVIALTARILLNKGSRPTSFQVSFRIWDKKGEGFIEGNYKLFSK